MKHNRFTPEGKQKIALVDIDETISFYADEYRAYEYAIPSPTNIAKINKYYDEGWKIIYWTARGSVSGIDYYDFTWRQLESWGCKFHDLICGKEKGHFDMIVDDKAKRIEEL